MSNLNKKKSYVFEGRTTGWNGYRIHIERGVKFDKDSE
jgi:hypothetical protein